MGMSRALKAAVAALIFAIGLAGSVAAEPFEDAAAAYMKGDYAAALRLMRPLAQQGHAGAQFNLGYMYENGRGVAKNDAIAVSWYRKSAEQGYADAQYKLGISYYNGWVVPRDDAAAVSWYRKAAAQGNARAQFEAAAAWPVVAEGPGAACPQLPKPDMSAVKRQALFVESPGGISPPGAPRTVHDPLESHGSRCSAVAMA
jgi:TPR repeat protein